MSRVQAMFKLMTNKVSAGLIEGAEQWQRRYEKGEDRWELGAAAPPLAAAIRDYAMSSEGKAVKTNGRAIVPGCGRGHEVFLLAELGFTAVGVDFADIAIADAIAGAKVRNLPATFVQADWMICGYGDGWAAHFQLLIEHTCFCAINPTQRADYVKSAARVLATGGLLLGLLWDCGREGGPPFTVSPDEMRHYFALENGFAIERLEPAQSSLPQRAGEWLMVARRL
jgi:methyl halide transferase